MQKHIRVGRSAAIAVLAVLFVAWFGPAVLGQFPAGEPGKPGGNAGASGSKAPGPECLRSAQEKLSAEGPEKALDAFRSCARDNANSLEAQQMLGMVYMMAKKPKEAADALKQAMKLDPNNAHTRAMLGRAYSAEQDKLDLAEELLKGVLESHPEMNDARMDLARVYLGKKQVEKALEQYDRVLSTERKYAIYHLEVGRLLAAMGLKEKAKKEFERSLVLFPDFQPAKEQLKLLEEGGAKGSAGAPETAATDKK